MIGEVMNFSPKNFGIQIKNDKGEFWYDVPKEMSEIFETVQKGQSINFSFEKKDGRSLLKTFELTIPTNASNELKPASEKKPYNLDWDLKKQENITKLALYNTATNIINGMQTKSFSDEEQTKRVIDTAKQLWKELVGDW